MNVFTFHNKVGTLPWYIMSNTNACFPTPGSLSLLPRKGKCFSIMFTICCELAAWNKLDPFSYDWDYPVDDYGWLADSFMVAKFVDGCVKMEGKWQLI